MTNVADNNCSGTQITHFVFNNVFFFENYAVYEIMWENVVERGKPQDNMAHSHCMLDNSGYKPTLGMCNTYCFPLQQWLQERTSMLRYTYITCLVSTIILFYFC